MENNIFIHQSSGFATHAITLEDKILVSKVEKIILNTKILSSEVKIITSEHQIITSEA